MRGGRGGGGGEGENREVVCGGLFEGEGGIREAQEDSGVGEEYRRQPSSEGVNR